MNVRRVLKTTNHSAIYEFEGWLVVVSEDKKGRFHVSMSNAPIGGVRKEEHPTNEDIDRAIKELVPNAGEREFDLMAPILLPGALHCIEKGYEQ